ncbi:DUF4442 domain-containing protein [Sulfitobacter delicatus]|uniref:Uncharacterized domain 1-containing protein n=1 Tax=Sulfitobacter delicatus TaxID=218672 RepID=A0A1G7QS61_9RHOB|nr:DUF4442 domain-containing protein [Sulfitobacter delicatus]SDG00500.1 uncharacterized domain 1-containing protein [Sulfitobacter delicatus]
MTPYDMIKSHLDTAVPFANHVGVKLLEIGDGTASAELVQRHETSNHIGTQHAGAMFTLGESASGAAMAGAIAPVIMDMRPVAAMGQIAFKRIAEGTLTAHAQTSRPGAELLIALQDEGKVAFDVTVDIRNEAGDTVVEMTMNWHVSAKR